VTEHDGTLYVLCFSDDGPATGPHPVSQEELRVAFKPSNGWNVGTIKPDRIQTRYHDGRRTGMVRDNQTDLECGTGRLVCDPVPSVMAQFGLCKRVEILPSGQRQTSRTAVTAHNPANQ